MFVIGFCDKPMKMARKDDGGLNIMYRRSLGFQWPHPHNLVSSWDISLAVKPDIMGVAGPNMQWSCFVCPSCYQKRENTAFVLGDFWVLENKLLQIVLHVGKGIKFGVEKGNGGQDICKMTVLQMWKIVKNTSKGWLIITLSTKHNRNIYICFYKWYINR